MSGSLLRDVVSRGGRLIRVLLSSHLEVAQQEAAEDLSRLAKGLTLLFIGAMVAVFGLGLLELSAVVLVAQNSEFDWWQALVVVAGANLLAAGVLALVGRQKLKQPLLRRTRGLVKRSFGVLSQENEAASDNGK